MNNDTFLIEDSDLEQARIICSEVKDSTTRCRAVANALAADITTKYFQEIEVDTDSGLHKIPQVLDKIDIADVYLKDAYIDVRIYFNDNELWVPKSHFDLGIQPLAYMFIKLNEDLSGGLVTGFVLSNTINAEYSIDGHVKIEEDSLISYYDIEPHLVTKYSDGIPENFESKIFDYLDDKLEVTELKDFYNVLVKNSECRKLLQDVAKAQTVFNFVSIVPKDNNFDSVQTGEKFLGLSEDDSSNDFMESNESIELELEEPESFDLGFSETEEMITEDDNSADMLEESDGFDLGFSETEEMIAEDDDSTDMLEESESFDLGFSETEEMIAEDDDSANMLEESDGFDFGFEDSNNSTVEESFIEVENFEESKNIVIDVEEKESDFAIVSGITENSDIDDNIQDEVQEYQIIDNIEESGFNENISMEENQFSTNVTPSMDSFENTDSDDELEKLLNNEASVFEENVENDTDEKVFNENSAQIEELFNNNEADSSVEVEEAYVQPSKKTKSQIIPLFGTIVILAAIGYLGYMKFINGDFSKETVPAQLPVTEKKNVSQAPVAKKPQKVAMPIETVDNVESKIQTNEGNAISIPAIEKNLDASIMVSNLSVSWEVPAAYVSSNTAKRYFTKMGKIIQLNLKTELLLLNKLPITNKIKLELEFDKNSSRFDVKSMTVSSGEKVVDDAIIQTVKNALNLNIKTNMATFGNMTGNPVLIIHL